VLNLGPPGPRPGPGPVAGQPPVPRGPPPIIGNMTRPPGMGFLGPPPGSVGLGPPRPRGPPPSGAPVSFQYPR
jgi:hypothetical protein